MGNDALRVSVVDVCRGSLVRAQVGAKRETEAILLHQDTPGGGVGTALVWSVLLTAPAVVMIMSLLGGCIVLM